MKLHPPFHHEAEFYILWTNCSFNHSTDEKLGGVNRKNSPHASSLATLGNKLWTNLTSPTELVTTHIQSIEGPQVRNKTERFVERDLCSLFVLEHVRAQSGKQLFLNFPWILIAQFPESPPSITCKTCSTKSLYSKTSTGPTALFLF